MKNWMLLTTCIVMLSGCSEPTSSHQPAKPKSDTQPQPEVTSTAVHSPTQQHVDAESSNLSATGSDLNASQNEFNIQLNLNSDVLFEFGAAELKPEAQIELDQVAETLKEKGKGIIAITGHTDSIGSDEANQKLSLARAEAVRDYFKSKNILLDYQVSGAGESHPIASNAQENGQDNPEGRQKNRRVEIIINKTKSLSE